MKLLALTVLSNLLVSSFTISNLSKRPYPTNPASSYQQLLTEYGSRTQNTSYRGSGRRAILALPPQSTDSPQ
jgi:hypothetical protein